MLLRHSTATLCGWAVGLHWPEGSSNNSSILARPLNPPQAFPRWGEVMDGWGTKLLSAVEVVSVAAALGLGLPRESFSSGLANGPHLVAPTGSDLARFGARGTVFAGFHYDLNFLTIHGKSRFPGLFVWLRDGRKARGWGRGEGVRGAEWGERAVEVRGRRVTGAAAGVQNGDSQRWQTAPVDN